jgi:hypothetical protein
MQVAAHCLGSIEELGCHKQRQFALTRGLQPDGLHNGITTYHVNSTCQTIPVCVYLSTGSRQARKHAQAGVPR